jgi:16S rRNA (adenine1518-N6/adenine1519-N6)-dimethyltransferase
MSAPRQTLTFLKQRLAAAGVRPRTALGQNFLIDLNLLDILVDAAALDDNDVVLEVGTGTGSLTALLAQRAAAVVTVEVDPAIQQLAAEHLAALPNVTMLREDVLRGKNRLNPAVLDAIDAQLAAAPDRVLKLVANLPYNAATPLIANLLALDRPPSSMTVAVQKELAERIAATPGCKDYGALSVWVQSQCRVEILRLLPPEAFWPRPKVSSAFIRIELDPLLRARIADRRHFHDFVRAIFLHRRKLLRSQLLAAVGGRLDKPAVDALLTELQLDGGLRAEQLSPDALLALAEAVRTRRQ